MICRHAYRAEPAAAGSENGDLPSRTSITWAAAAIIRKRASYSTPPCDRVRSTDRSSRNSISSLNERPADRAYISSCSFSVFRNLVLKEALFASPDFSGGRPRRAGFELVAATAHTHSRLVSIMPMTWLAKLSLQG